MGLMIKFFCALLVIGLVGLFVLKKPDGSPWLSIADFTPDTTLIKNDALSLINKVKKTTASDTGEKKQGGIYRWKDANGQWQFSDTAPTDQTAETITVSGNLNSDLSEKYTPPKKPENKIVDKPEASNSIIPSTLSPEKISKLMKDANNVQQLMDERASQMEKQLK